MALLVAPGSIPRAETLTVDFSGPPGDDYTVTVLDDTLSSLAAAPANGRFEITGQIVAGSEPKVILEPNATVLAGDTWSVEARFLVAHTLIASLAVRDSVQTWISIGNALDDDDDARAKSGVLAGPFDFGGMTVNSSYFASSGFVFDEDSVPGSASTTEYSVVEPEIAGPGATVVTTLRVEYDPELGELTTAYAIDGGPFVSYVLQDEGQPAPVVDPQAQWMLGRDDEIDVFLLFSATRAAAGPGESGDITSSFGVASGEVWFDDLVVTSVPEPAGAAAGVVACVMIGALSRRAAGPRASGAPARRRRARRRPRWPAPASGSVARRAPR